MGALALCTWLSDYLLDVILSSPHSFGSLEISPHGHRQDGYLTHHWDSIAIKNGENTFILRNTDLDITLFQENRNIQLQAGNNLVMLVVRRAKRLFVFYATCNIEEGYL